MSLKTAADICFEVFLLVVGCYSTSIVWKGEKRCNILDTSSTIAGNRILVSLLFVKLETTCGRFVDFWWFSFWNKTVIIIFYSALFFMAILSKPNSGRGKDATLCNY